MSKSIYLVGCQLLDLLVSAKSTSRSVCQIRNIHNLNCTFHIHPKLNFMQYYNEISYPDGFISLKLPFGITFALVFKHFAVVIYVDFVAWDTCFRQQSPHIYSDKRIFMSGWLPIRKSLTRLTETIPVTQDLYSTSGSWFNIMMSSYQYRKSHCGDKTVIRPSYLRNGISYTGKMPSSYWVRALKTTSKKHTNLFTN